MPLYEVDKPNAAMKQVDPSDFVSQKVLERKDLQPLLRNHLEAIDPDIMLLSEEFGNFQDANRRVDLLALDRDGNLVVIELKRVDDGSHMELQAIRYAAMISALDMNAVADIYAAQLKKTGKDENTARQEISEFLEPDAQISNTPRIVLIAPGFSREITTAVLWLNTVGLDIRCLKVELYNLKGQLYLDLEQIIPLPSAADYQYKIRAKTEAIQKSATKKRASNSIPTLVSAGVLKPGMRVHMVRPPRPSQDITDPKISGAKFVGGTAFEWDQNGKVYTSITALTEAICEHLGGVNTGFAGPDHWTLEGEQETLNIKAKNILLGASSVADGIGL